MFVLNSAFTTKDNYFQVALDDAIDAFNAVLLGFGSTQQLQRYNPETHHVHPPSQHPFLTSCFSTSPHRHSFTCVAATLLRCLFRHRHFVVLSASSSDDYITSLHFTSNFKLLQKNSPNKLLTV